MEGRIFLEDAEGSTIKEDSLVLKPALGTSLSSSSGQLSSSDSDSEEASGPGIAWAAGICFPRSLADILGGNTMGFHSEPCGWWVKSSEQQPTLGRLGESYLKSDLGTIGCSSPASQNHSLALIINYSHCFEYLISYPLLG